MPGTNLEFAANITFRSPLLLPSGDRNHLGLNDVVARSNNPSAKDGSSTRHVWSDLVGSTGFAARLGAED